jgi:hypothetical protein
MDAEEFKRLGKERPPSDSPPMADQELYNIYASWSANLHAWVLTQLGRHVDAEFFPAPEWKFKIYSGQSGVSISESGIMNLNRPEGEKSFTLALPRPEHHPTKAELDKTFRNLCLATAKLLEIELHAPKLKGPASKHLALDEPRRPKKIRSSARRRRAADEN